MHETSTFLLVILRLIATNAQQCGKMNLSDLKNQLVHAISKKTDQQQKPSEPSEGKQKDDLGSRLVGTKRIVTTAAVADNVKTSSSSVDPSLTRIAQDQNRAKGDAGNVSGNTPNGDVPRGVSGNLLGAPLDSQASESAKPALSTVSSRFPGLPPGPCPNRQLLSQPSESRFPGVAPKPCPIRRNTTTPNQPRTAKTRGTRGCRRKGELVRYRESCMPVLGTCMPVLGTVVVPY